MSALWVLPLVVLAAGAAAVAAVARRLATEIAGLQAEAVVVRELIDDAELARSEATDAANRGVELARLRDRAAAIRRPALRGGSGPRPGAR